MGPEGSPGGEAELATEHRGSTLMLAAFLPTWNRKTWRLEEEQKETEG